ncbi:MAG: 30S ribosomal protein S5 [Planctomycetota bacterium]|jgi:small subunit ribosomal protein S5|nr:30S ribosomal protein S5 [Planctomycetota bacterium]
MSSETREKDGWIESVVSIRRCSATVKGGRRFTFNALVVIGDGRGTIGWGYGKANEVPPSVDKGVKDAKKQLKKVLLKGGTIPHRVEGRFGASRVVMLPANPGTGVIAGGAVRAVVQAVGVTDILTKCYGSTNKLNLVKATINGLTKLRTKEDIARLRGVEL